MPVALPYDVRLRLLRVTHGRTNSFGINMVGWRCALNKCYLMLQEGGARLGAIKLPYGTRKLILFLAWAPNYFSGLGQLDGCMAE